MIAQAAMNLYPHREPNYRLLQLRKVMRKGDGLRVTKNTCFKRPKTRVRHRHRLQGLIGSYFHENLYLAGHLFNAMQHGRIRSLLR